MSSTATTAAMSLLPVAPLDGESGYIRWKESVVLRLHTLGLGHVLFEEARPASEKQRRDDALCRGHILATLSERLLPVYAHHATAGAVWRAVGLTYDLDMAQLSSTKANAFRYDEGKPLLEQLALLQALVAVGKSSDMDSCMPYYVDSSGFPSEVARKVDKLGSDVRMDEIWKIVRKQVVLDRTREIDQHRQNTTDGQGNPTLKRGRQGN